MLRTDSFGSRIEGSGFRVEGVGSGDSGFGFSCMEGA